MNVRRFLITGLVISLLITLYGSLKPATGGIDLPYIDKIAHFIMHGSIAFFGISFMKNKPWVILFISVAILFGVSLELLQRSIPGRSFEYADIVANSLGTLLGSYLGYKALSSLKKFFKS